MASQLDFFGANAASQNAGARVAAKGAKAKKSLDDIDAEDMAKLLEATGNYRILRKLEPRAVAEQPRPNFKRRGIILDTETTGLNHKADEIIEIGIIAFTFDDLGLVGDVTGIYGGLHQPSQPIPEDITRLTGITDDMVAGQAIDLTAVASMIETADLVIAHNAGFDRPFCERFSPVFHGKAWACSVNEVDWKRRGFEGNKLGYLIGQAGYFHDGHRAVDDCFALLEVLERSMDATGATAFSELYAASQRSKVRIYAENSPFDMKDHLKARGYRWSDGTDGRPKSWWIELQEEELDAELQFLRKEIYRWDADPLIKRLTAFDRFRAA
ncbi:3'-5' exonuclease [Agrobacterium larrymoorei]|uniref:3'-5' exonuclease n=1 Tax=Agrobacterium larrymoorei TaxID=160699 RepID=A0A4D7DUQ7_9HYPH|nr:3'-5' exonuclease [Agrobacterium larrymoorei]QCJ00762.1 3'-5' exonuclease [Agrobacterium larrymoorei]QYA10765.1 3'-5' exonuclease [Agrobacterium larrymoorei]